MRKRTLKPMENVTLTDVYRELRQVRKELHELRESMIPEEEISPEEHRELDQIYAEMCNGKEVPWHQIRKK